MGTKKSTTAKKISAKKAAAKATLRSATKKATATTIKAKATTKITPKITTQKTTSKNTKTTKTVKPTCIEVNYDVGFNNTLYIRGEGGSLTWDKGCKMKNMGSDKWVWETKNKFTTCEFKVLINDEEFEAGENKKAKCGLKVSHTPQFS